MIVIILLPMTSSPAAVLGMTSALLSLVCLLEFIYLYVMNEHTPPQVFRTFQVPILVVFGAVGAVGVGAGIGSFITFLGLGIIEAINEDRKRKERERMERECVVCVCVHVQVVPARCVWRKGICVLSIC